VEEVEVPIIQQEQEVLVVLDKSSGASIWLLFSFYIRNRSFSSYQFQHNISSYSWSRQELL
jgi:hypothetical protein